MRLAIIADIHGNIQALDAVLADIAQQGVDQIIINGDLVNRGPNNVEVLERLIGQGYTITLGNHDDLIRKWATRDPDLPAAWYADPFWESMAWGVEQLRRAGWLEALHNLPMIHRVEVPDAPSLLIAHGSPRHYRDGYAFLTEEQLQPILADNPADILIGSHIHRPFERVVGHQTLINTGAVGAPFNGDWRAQYLLLTLRGSQWEWSHQAVPYDHPAALAAYESSGYLPAGNLSAWLFREELRHAVSLYAPFWLWGEKYHKPMTWENWLEFYKLYKDKLALPDNLDGR